MNGVQHAAIDCRAMRRSVLHWSSFSSTSLQNGGPRAADQHQIADVHISAGAWAEDDDGIAAETP